MSEYTTSPDPSNPSQTIYQTVEMRQDPRHNATPGTLGDLAVEELVFISVD